MQLHRTTFFLVILLILITAIGGCGGCNDAATTAMQNITECDVNKDITTPGVNAADYARFGLLRDWPKARTELARTTREEAESNALDELNDIIKGITCPDGCKLVLVGTVSYSTSHTMSGSKGLAWIRYDCLATSSATQVVKCETKTDE